MWHCFLQDGASELEKLKGLPWNLNGSLEEPLVAGPDAGFEGMSRIFTSL